MAEEEHDVIPADTSGIELYIDPNAPKLPNNLHPYDRLKINSEAHYESQLPLVDQREKRRIRWKLGKKETKETVEKIKEDAGYARKGTYDNSAALANAEVDIDFGDDE